MTLLHASNNNGNVVSQKIARPGFFDAQRYRYDEVNRLCIATEGVAPSGPDGCPGGEKWCRDFGYDAFGNRAIVGNSGPTLPQATPTSLGAFSTATNRLTVTGYDNAGNLTGHTGLAQEILYDAENRMVEFSGPAGLQREGSYAYDGEGRRVLAISTIGGTSTTTVYVYDAFGNLAAEYATQAPSNPGTYYRTTDHLGSTRLITKADGTVDDNGGCLDFYPFGEQIESGTGNRSSVPCYGGGGELAQKFTAKERDDESGLDYFGARYFSASLGRFVSTDPSFLNILKAVNPQRMNLYGYGINNPLRFVDPDGKEAVAILYPTYEVGVRGDFTLPLGHAGVVMIAKDGSSHYFEYGRYRPAGAGGNVAQGRMRSTTRSSVQRDASGRITPESMKALLGNLSQTAGKGGIVEAAVFDTNETQDAAMEAYLNERVRQNEDSNRRHYSPFSHNCGTLICDALDAADRPFPAARTFQTPAYIFSNFMAWPRQFGVTQIFIYAPPRPKEKIDSKICYQDDKGRSVCQ